MGTQVEAALGPAVRGIQVWVQKSVVVGTLGAVTEMTRVQAAGWSQGMAVVGQDGMVVVGNWVQMVVDTRILEGMAVVEY